MFVRKFVILNLIVHVIIVLSYIDVAHSRCSRTPEGSGARRSQSTGNFRLRLSDDSNVYTPGRQYTVFLERNSNAIRSRDHIRPSFIGFFLAVEQKNNNTSMLAEDFSQVKHGIFKIEEENTLVKFSCGNVVTHSSETAKREIYVNWTAPEKGAGCVVFRATIIEHRDVWYMDDGPLTKEFCEDEEAGEDFISNVLEECCACYEAKYEITFEGLWSRNTHPKDFPRNVYTTKFGDIIGATHTTGNSFWANGQVASEGLKEVAEMGSTRKLESELKNKSESIRTIIKARGLSYPNITGKTFAVFRVDSEHHLVSFISNISPSPDWFVGISSMELCLTDCTWLESKVVDLYPWDAGTDKGVTYDAPDQPSKPQEFIRRITSESPNNVDSPFYIPNGSKMKPLARLTLLRQRLYEKNCTADQSENEENISYDPMCEGYLTEWSACEPNCKTRDGEVAKQTRRYTKGYFKYCFNRGHPLLERFNCEPIDWCVGQNQDRDQTPESTDAEVTTEPEINVEEEQTKQPRVDCRFVPYGNPTYGPCNGSCGIGKRTRTQSRNVEGCEPKIETVDCQLDPCENNDFCTILPDKDNCSQGTEKRNAIFYNATTCTCSVFTTVCEKQESTNIFDTFDECETACPVDSQNCNGGGARPYNPKPNWRNRQKNNY